MLNIGIFLLTLSNQKPGSIAMVRVLTIIILKRHNKCHHVESLAKKYLLSMQHRGISILGEHTSFWHPQTTYCEYPVKNFWLLGQRGGLQFLGIICHFGIFRHHIEYLERKNWLSVQHGGFNFGGAYVILASNVLENNIMPTSVAFGWMAGTVHLEMIFTS